MHVHGLNILSLFSVLQSYDKDMHILGIKLHVFCHLYFFIRAMSRNTTTTSTEVLHRMLGHL
jgi:hypothetical protein